MATVSRVTRHPGVLLNRVVYLSFCIEIEACHILKISKVCRKTPLKMLDKTQQVDLNSLLEPDQV